MKISSTQVSFFFFGLFVGFKRGTHLLLFISLLKCSLDVTQNSFGFVHSFVIALIIRIFRLVRCTCQLEFTLLN